MIVEKIVDIIDDNFAEFTGSNEATLQAAEDIKIMFQDLQKEILNSSEEIISTSGLRFEGVHIEKIKQCFEKIGVSFVSPF